MEMTKSEKKAMEIREKIKGIISDQTLVAATWRTVDTSVNAELRLRAAWSIVLPVDQIHYPRDLSGKTNELWAEMHEIARKITSASVLAEGDKNVVIPINARRKGGLEKRAEARASWEIEAGKQFLALYRSATTKKRLAAARKKIAELQAKQKALLPRLRESNAAYLAGKKAEREKQNQINAEAFKSGRFWEASREAIKQYFHPPFQKNYLADVSERWRAALILECVPVSYEIDRVRRRRLAGTGRGYLCGIDDNGDEWGHRVNGISLSRDEYDIAALDGTVEDAMSILFRINPFLLADCHRQGDLLFCPVSIPADVDMTHHEKSWTPRESHTISSTGLKHNGRYFRSDEKITVAHTSHAPVVLDPGEYRLYMSQAAADAD